MDTTLIMQAYRYRLYPTPAQEQMFVQIAGCCRLVYNKALEAHQKAWTEEQKSLSAIDLINQIPAWKQEHAFLKTPPAQTLQAVVRDLADGWNRFFKGQNEKPTWRTFSDDPRFRFPDPQQFVIRNVKGTKKAVRHLLLPKMGMSGKLGPVVMVMHRPIDGKVKNLTIKREGGLWFASFVAQKKARIPAVVPRTVIGADAGLTNPMMTSEGVRLGETIVTRASLSKLARLQRIVSRKLEVLRSRMDIPPGGSLKGVARPNALIKAQQRVAAFLGKMARKRKDQAHKIAKALVGMADAIVLEDLDTKALTSKDADSSRDHRRRILDVSWAQIATFVAYKAAWAGKICVRANPAYTSQRCSACHHTEEKNRNGEVFLCLTCGHGDHADVNAAKNIRDLGVAMIAALLTERVDGPCLRPEDRATDPQRDEHRSGGTALGLAPGDAPSFC